MFGMRVKRCARTQARQSGAMPAMRGVATALFMLMVLAWRLPHPAPDTS
jgi:hypothetical protein